MEPITVAMELIAPAFADQGDLRAGGTPKRGIGVRYADLEFIEALHACGDEINGSGSTSYRVASDVDAIQGYRILVAARAGNGAAAIAKSTGRRRVVRGRGRLQSKKLRRIALERRQADQRRSSDNISNLCVRGLQLNGRFGHDRDRLRHFSHLQRQVDCGAFIYVYGYSRYLRGPKTGFLYGDRVLSRGYIDECKFTGGVGCLRGLGIRPAVTKCDGSIGNRRSTVIRNRSDHRSGRRRLRISVWRDEQEGRKHSKNKKEKT